MALRNEREQFNPVMPLAPKEGGGGGEVVSARWGEIEGSISAQTDLNNKLNSKVQKVSGITGTVLYANTGGADTTVEASNSAIPNHLVQRDDSGLFSVETPIAPAHPTPKSYVDDKTDANGLSSTIVGSNDITVDVSEDEQSLVIGTHAKTVTISDVPPTAEQGTFTEEQISALEESINSIIVFNNEIYRLNDNGHEAGIKGYSHTGVENGVFMLKNITVTLNTRAWVLTTKEVS